MAFNILPHRHKLTLDGGSQSKNQASYRCPLCESPNFKLILSGKKAGHWATYGCDCSSTEEGKRKIRHYLSPAQNPNETEPTWQKPVRASKSVTYPYDRLVDGQIEAIAQVKRSDDGMGKRYFSQSHWDGKHWVSGLPDDIKSQVHLYRIFDPINQDAIAKGEPLLIVEGEGKVDKLHRLSIPATCSIGGAGKWGHYGHQNYLQDLAGAVVVICPDRDKPGIKHAEQVAADFPEAQWLYSDPTSPEWETPPDNKGFDVGDWVESGATKEQILGAIAPRRMATVEAPTTEQTAQPEPRPEKRSIADQLIDIGRGAGISYFKTSDGTVYADVKREGKRQTMSLRSKDFKQHLRAELFDQANKSPGAEAVTQAIDTLEALAQRKCPEQEVKNRLADNDGKIYIDLADESWEAIEVDGDGWRVTGDYPVRFRRGGTSPMAKPSTGGSLEELRELCQFSFDTWVLIVCYLVQCLKPSGEYPVLCLHGPGGSGKSTITKMLKRLIDPSPVLTRSNVGDVRQFAIHATKRHMVAIDNLSGLSAEQSDILCRAATGGGHAERTLHSDDDETTFNFVNPLILNGIDSIATRGDLLSRSFLVTLSAPEKRLPESVFEQRFAAMQPGVFGALLDLLSQVLAILPSIEGTYGGSERFVGFVELGLAIEQVMEWESGTVLRVLAGVREEAHETAIESSPVGQAIQDFMLGREQWTGTANELLKNLSGHAAEKVTRSNYWPSDATRLSKTLTRLEPDLTALGMEIRREKRTGGLRMVTIERIDRTTAMPPASSDAVGELRQGAKLVVSAGDYSQNGLRVGTLVTLREVRVSDPSPEIPKPQPFGIVIDQEGKPHSVWLTHLKPCPEQNDRLGMWEAA
jgi:energy-coupling factor transporter ATP-binding protein EcfA2